RLAQAGHDVTFVARGAHLQALRSTGLELRSALGDLHLPSVRAVADPEPIADADVVLFTVKAQHGEAAARELLPLAGERSRLLTLQNGVEGVTLLERMFGRERVWGGVAYLEAVVSAPGQITHRSPFARIVFGPLAGADARAEQALEAFRDAGIEADLTAEPREAVWRKWVLICAFSGLTALTRKPIGDVLAQPETRELFRGAAAEVAALAAASGAALPRDVVDATMAFASETMQPSMTSSLAQDLAAGKPLELEALNGAASRLGRELGVPTPVNDFIYAALALHVGGNG
ncbi:MAG: 2-dehydropantoate 2-reductase, partial [Deinococcales bacterium]